MHVSVSVPPSLCPVSLCLCPASLSLCSASLSLCPVSLSLCPASLSLCHVRAVGQAAAACGSTLSLNNSATQTGRSPPFSLSPHHRQHNHHNTIATHRRSHPPPPSPPSPSAATAATSPRTLTRALAEGELRPSLARAR